MLYLDYVEKIVIDGKFHQSPIAPGTVDLSLQILLLITQYADTAPRTTCRGYEFHNMQMLRLPPCGFE